jgi:O-antigen/teichoic acid export membrane protein
LIPRLFSYGAAIASVVAEIVIAVSQILYVRKEIEIKKIVAPCVKYLIAGALMLALLVFETNVFPASILGTFGQIISGALLYFVALILLHDSFFIENATMVMNKIKSKIGGK